MLQPILNNILSSKKIILASNSVRRKDLLNNIGLKFEVIPSDFDENSLDQTKYKNQKEYVLDIARHKVSSVFDSCKQSNNIPDIIIGADTIVELNNRLFGKPKDKEQAVEFLRTLSGNPHTVHTAVVIKSPMNDKYFIESTVVHMASLTPDIINAYVETNDPLDKAGAYGIQGIGGTLIEKIEGDFYNVMGLPLHKFCINLRNLIEES